MSQTLPAATRSASLQVPGGLWAQAGPGSPQRRAGSRAPSPPSLLGGIRTSAAGGNEAAVTGARVREDSSLCHLWAVWGLLRPTTHSSVLNASSVWLGGAERWLPGPARGLAHPAAPCLLREMVRNKDKSHPPVGL